METIDQKVQLVLEKELKELNQAQREVNEVVKQIAAFDNQHESGFRLSPKDTIGKNMVYNTTLK